MKHDDNNMLADDELVSVRDFSKMLNMHVYTYEMNIPPIKGTKSCMSFWVIIFK